MSWPSGRLSLQCFLLELNGKANLDLNAALEDVGREHGREFAFADAFSDHVVANVELSEGARHVFEDACRLGFGTARESSQAQAEHVLGQRLDEILSGLAIGLRVGRQGRYFGRFPSDSFNVQCG